MIAAVPKQCRRYIFIMRHMQKNIRKIVSEIVYKVGNTYF